MTSPVGGRPLALLSALTMILAWVQPVQADHSTEDHLDLGPLVMGGDYDYPPWEFIDDDGMAAGFHVDLMKAIAKEEGLEVTYRFGPWREMRRDLESGDIDVLAMVRTPKREKLLDFSVPHAILSHEFFVRQNDSYCDSFDDLRHRKIIVQNRALPHEYLLAQGLKDNLILVETESQALRLLSTGYYDCALVTDLGGRFMIHRHDLTNLTTTGPPLLSGKYCLAVSGGNTALRNRLNRGLETLKASGRFEEIHGEWIGEPGDLEAGDIIRYTAMVLVPLALLLTLAFTWTWSLRRQVTLRTEQLKREARERQRLEDQLRQAQKMEAIGQLAGGIAHDFNNILGGIMGYASVLKAESSPGDRTYEAAATIEMAAERAAGLTRQLLGFARKGKFRTVAVDLHTTISEVIEILLKTLDEGIRTELDLVADRSVVRGDPGQLHQVIMNLAVNARDAMSEGGLFTIRTRVDTLEDGYEGPDPSMKSGNYLVVSATDSGCGIPLEAQEHIFEPFFTTKGPGAGTGMGLATAYGIVKNHGGSILVDSEEGRGTTFMVFLPLADNQATETDGPISEDPQPGSGHILLVDDESLIRDVASAMLRRLGYQVTVVSNGQEALEHYRKNPRDVDLVLLDMTMPEMSGRDCFHRLREMDPSVRVVLSTGFGQAGMAQEIVDEGMMGFVQKPYDLAVLSRVIRRALRKPPPV